MGANLVTYYQKSSPTDQTGISLRNGNNKLGNVVVLEPSDKSPFLGDIKAGRSQSAFVTNMYKAPIFPHEVASTEFLLVRSAKGKLSIRRIDRITVVGQQEPLMEVLTPQPKNLQTYIINRLLVYVYREFRAAEKRGIDPCIRVDELTAQFPNASDTILRKKMKECALLQKGANEHLLWSKKRDFVIPSEEGLKKFVLPENVCAYESMQAGLYRLKHLGITRLTVPNCVSTAMSQLPDEAIALAAASHIERELQITPWSLSSNFVACRNQDRDNIERLEITGVGDPSGRGLGFSYVRTAPKAPISNAMAKKKAAARGSSIVTGTDADLRRLSMEAAREVLLKFDVPEEQITKLTRWHRMAMIHKLSSEQAASRVKVNPTATSKYARGQRMSYLQLQQQTREKCQEIWDRQLQSLSTADGDEMESDSEANSDLDFFAGDLENLLDAEEFEGDESNYASRNDKTEGVKGIKMRRHPSQAQTEEENEDEAAEAAALCRLLNDDDEAEKKKIKAKPSAFQGGLPLIPKSKYVDNVEGSKPKTKIHSNGSYVPKESITTDSKELENSFVKKKLKPVKKNFAPDSTTTPVIAKVKLVNDELEQKLQKKKSVIKPKALPVKFVCGSSEEIFDTPAQSLERHISSDARPDSSDMDIGIKTVGKISKIKISSKSKPEDVQVDSHKPSIVIRPPVDTERSQYEYHKPSIVIRPPANPEKDHVESYKPSIVIRPPAVKEREHKKIVIRQPKEVVDLDQVSQEGSTGFEYRKVKKIAELSGFETQMQPATAWQYPGELSKNKVREERRWWEEEEKRNIERSSRFYGEDNRGVAERGVAERRRYEEAVRMEREEEWKRAKKRKKQPDYSDDYLEDYRTSRKMPERDRGVKRQSISELGKYGAEHASGAKRRRGGEVGLANILEGIVDVLRDRQEVSYLFLKPVSKKEAPDYLDIVEKLMDLSTIQYKVRKMEYKNRYEFRRDVWQIKYNAHLYNDGRNPGIPPRADQLLKICDYLLREQDHNLTEAEEGIEF